MHRQSRIGISFCFLLAALCFTGASAIEFQEILSFDVPGLAEIQKLDFGDIDFDCHPEILASDGTTAVLYSYHRDEVLFSFELTSLGDPSYEDLYGIVLSDINRDQFPDVAAGVLEYAAMDAFLHLFFYNGTGFWQQIETFTTTYIGSAAGMIGMQGLKLFDAVDFNDDGFTEFVFSFDSSASSGINTETVYGVTDVFFSFPDSVVFHDNQLYSNPMPFPGQYSHYTGLRAHTGSHMEFPGDWRTSDAVRFQIFHDFQYSRSTVFSTVTGPTSYCNRTGEFSSFLPKCVGDIDTTRRGIEIVVSRSQTSCCYDGGTADCTSSSELGLYTFDPPDRLIGIWGIPPVSAGTFFFLRESPGSFYGFTDDSVFQFDGLDGSVIYSQPHRFPERRTWKNLHEVVYPNQQYLVTSAGNRISVYKPVVITDAEGGEDHPPIPRTLTIGRPYPNPFNAPQTIPVSVKPNTPLTVTVYDLRGRKITRLFDGVAGERAKADVAGRKPAHWNLFR